MKTRALVPAGTALFITAAAFLSYPFAGTAPKAVKEVKPVSFMTTVPVQEKAGCRSTVAGPATGEEDANFAMWRKRFDALLSEHGDRERAIEALLEEIGSRYQAWMQEQIALPAGGPGAEQRGELAELEQAAGRGIEAILEAAGIDAARRESGAAATVDRIAAEIHYSKAAPDASSRIALLWLDREHQVRRQEALAHTGESEKSEALATLETWYAEARAGILAGAEQQTGG